LGIFVHSKDSSCVLKTPGQHTTLGNQIAAMTLLMRERQIELAGEQSRYFGLIRWELAKQTINGEQAAEPGDGKQPFQDKNV